MRVTRQVEIDLTVEEMAIAFANMCNDEQAEFLNTVGETALNWPNGGWCLQFASVVEYLSSAGRGVIDVMAAHVAPDDNNG